MPDDPKALIFDVKRYAVHDGPGIRTTYFVKGCPLRCKWCQNPESFLPAQRLSLHRLKCTGCGACRLACPKIGDDLLINSADCTLCGRCIAACKPAARGFEAQEMAASELVRGALREKLYFDISGGGVTISGGECLTRPDFTAAALRGLKQAGIHTAVDTCGHVPRAAFDAVLPYTDLFLYDIKKIDPAFHRELTGADNSLILGNLEYICGAGARVIARVPLIPGLTDSPGDIAAIAAFIASRLKGRVERVELLPYNKLAESKYSNTTAWRNADPGPYPPGELEAQSNEYVARLKGIMEDAGLRCFAEVL